nr:hypothetical protein [uncultured Rhodopila sp.]
MIPDAGPLGRPGIPFEQFVAEKLEALAGLSQQFMNPGVGL